MTTKELMVGDWVLMDMNYLEEEPMYTKTDYKPYKIKNGEDLDLACETNCIGDGDVYRPIPLTPEILEKNGFKNISTHTLKGYDTFRLDIEQRGFDYCITIKLKDYFKLQSYDDRWYTLCEMEFGCNYIHELQHALRLCGIEKEIEL